MFYLEKGEILISENDEKYELYWLLKGELDVIKTVNGIEQKVARINAGDLVGEIAFVDRKKRTATGLNARFHRFIVSNRYFIRHKVLQF